MAYKSENTTFRELAGRHRKLSSKIRRKSRRSRYETKNFDTKIKSTRKNVPHAGCGRKIFRPQNRQAESSHQSTPAAPHQPRKTVKPKVITGDNFPPDPLAEKSANRTRLTTSQKNDTLPAQNN